MTEALNFQYGSHGLPWELILTVRKRTRHSRENGNPGQPRVSRGDLLMTGQMIFLLAKLEAGLDPCLRRDDSAFSSGEERQLNFLRSLSADVGMTEPVACLLGNSWGFVSD